MSAVSPLPRRGLDDSAKRPAPELASEGLRAGLLSLAVGLLAVAFGLDSLSPRGRLETGDLVRLGAALLAAIPVLIQLIHHLRDETADSFTDQLVTLAVLGAIVTGEFTTAILIPAVMDLAHLLEQRGIPGTHSAIEGLKRLTSRNATVVDETGEHIVAADAVQTDQILIVHPGDVLTSDGVVLEGFGAIDESSLTGESIPRDAFPGTTVLAGTVNVDGHLRIRVTRTGEATALGNIRRMLSAAMLSKSPLTQIVERYAQLYVPVVLLLAALVFVTTRDLQRVITVFVVSCPCTLVLSGPAAMIAALANATRHGVLIKNTRFLDSLADSETVVLDKTGTLTVGELALVSMQTHQAVNAEQLLSVAAACAAASRHPVSRAIVRHAAEQGIASKVSSGHLREVSGRGVEWRTGSAVFRLGRPAWLSGEGVSLHCIPSHCGPVVGVSENRNCLGYLLFADELRSDADTVITDMRTLGINRIVLVTGDRAASAHPVAERLSVDACVTDALPQDKLAAVRRERDAGRCVVVVGDGVNDALALAAGSVGIAMGARGSDIAIQSADIALMANDLTRIVFAIRLARRTRAVIAQNIGIALSSSAVMFGLGTLGLISPLGGAVLHNLGTALVLLNSSRVLKVK